jgi:hypothetical protein
MTKFSFVDNNEITVFCKSILTYKACLTMFNAVNGKPQSLVLPDVARVTLPASNWSLVVLEEVLSLEEGKLSDNFKVSNCQMHNLRKYRSLTYVYACMFLALAVGA